MEEEKTHRRFWKRNERAGVQRGVVKGWYALRHFGYAHWKRFVIQNLLPPRVHVQMSNILFHCTIGRSGCGCTHCCGRRCERCQRTAAHRSDVRVRAWADQNHGTPAASWGQSEREGTCVNTTRLPNVLSLAWRICSVELRKFLSHINIFKLSIVVYSRGFGQRNVVQRESSAKCSL